MVLFLCDILNRYQNGYHLNKKACEPILGEYSQTFLEICERITHDEDITISS